MSSVGRFGTNRKSAWAEMQAWRARRQSAADAFESTSQDMLTRLNRTFDNQSTETTRIVVNKVNARIRTELQARMSSLNVKV